MPVPARSPAPSPRPSTGRLRVILHIGPQKTGTSYMQRRLYHHAPKLAGDGIAYHTATHMEAAAPGHPVHATDIGTLLSRGELARFQEEIAAFRATGMQCLVLSSEHLSKLPPQQIAPLRDIFAKDDVEIYAYCRRWSERLPSLWWQQISTGGTTPFPQWYTTTLRRGGKSWVVNESRLWQRWAGLFGRDTINILSYDVLRDADIDIAEDFIQNRLRWPGELHTSSAGRQVRVMPSALEVEVVRSLYDYAAENGLPLNIVARHRILAALRAADFQPFRDLAGDVQQTVMIDDTDPLFAPALADMHAWADRLATADLSPAFMLPRQVAFPFLPRRVLRSPMARAAFGEVLATV